MTNTMDMGSAAGGAALLNKRSKWHAVRHGLGLVPGFVYLLMFYLIVAAAVQDLNNNFLVLGENYEFSWLRVINSFNLLVIATGAYHIARSSANKLSDVLVNTMVAGGYLVLFVIGAMGNIPIFNNIDFLWLMLSSWILSFLAIYINSKMNQRTMGVVTGGEEHNHGNN
jgi:hypothetical protein